VANIITAQVEVEGVRPMLLSYFSPEAAIPLEKREKTGVAGNDPEEWRRRVLTTKGGQLYLPATYVFGVVKEGARYTKKGKSTLVNEVVACLQVLDDKVLVDRFLPEEPVPTDDTLPVYMDIRSVKNPGSKARNVRYRIACSPGWKVGFGLRWDKTIVSRAEMEAVVNDGGMFSGLGDGRKIGFGRFSVSKFEVAD
jgi:hypothetical protein